MTDGSGDLGESAALAHEEQYVHGVYAEIASHFSATRYKGWPIVDEFLANIPAGFVGIDVGCGNGKYLSKNPNIFIIGSDRCENLVQIAKKNANGQDAVTADILKLPHLHGSLDFALSIAVIHHLSSESRRIEAISSILSAIKPAGQGKALLYVWALEQKNSRRGWDEGSDQDVLVPWVLNKGFAVSSRNNDGGLGYSTSSKSEPYAQTFLRYYHLYKEGELESHVSAAGGRVIKNGYEKDNWWAIIERKP